MSNPIPRLAGRMAVCAATLALLLFVTGGCDQSLTDINRNPNRPEDVPARNVLLNGILNVVGGSNGLGDLWVQHIAENYEIYADRYQLRPWDDGIWGQLYGPLTDLADVKGSVENGEDDNMWAVAEILTVYGFAVITDTYGDVPYFDALRLRDSVAYPAYDAQSEIYPDLIARLAAASDRIDPGAPLDFGDYDPIYHGDMVGWRMYANSLRLRLAMRMVNVAPADARNAFQAAWASEIFADIADQAEMHWLERIEADENIAVPTISLSESLVDRLVAFNDPRLPIYALPAVADGQYRGLRNGLDPSDYIPQRGVNDFSQIGTRFRPFGRTRPQRLVSYAEVLFLGAEAAALGWDVGGATAAELYESAMRAAMEDLDVDAADIDAYLAQPEVGYTTGIYQGLDAIHVQKWVSLFSQGTEAFADMRRIGWNFTTDAGTSGGDLLPAEQSFIGSEFPSRVTYPATESRYNPENFPGDAQMTDPVWWMN